MKWDEVIKGINAGFDTSELQAMDTANKTGDLLKMIDAGMTAEQIRALDTDGLFTYAGAQGPKPAATDPKPAATDPKPAATDPKPVDSKSDIVDSINTSIKEAFDTLTKELVKMQVAGSQQPTEQGTDDILAQIIAPELKERGK